LRIGGGKYGLGVWSSRFGVLLNCAQGNIVGYSGFDPIPPKKAQFVRAKLQQLCRYQLGLYALVFTFATVMGWWSSILHIWILPLLVGEPLHAFFHIADHLNCESDYKNGRANTRSTPAPAFVRFNMWNMNYHAEHHLYPSIPFHKLPDAHLKLDGHFEHTSPSAVAMHKHLLTRWMPHIRSRLLKGIRQVEEDWIPCPEK
jgi:fatty acid desaturase